VENQKRGIELTRRPEGNNCRDISLPGKDTQKSPARQTTADPNGFPSAGGQTEKGG